MMKKKYGELTRSIVTDIPADLNSEEYKHYFNTLPYFRGQAVYVYSFKKRRMIFARGWYNLLGYPDNEINLLKIVNNFTPKYSDFINDLTDKALQYLSSLGKNTDLEKFSFTAESEQIHKDESHIPLFFRVGVLKANNGEIEEIMGVYNIVKSLTFGNIMQYAAYGPNTDVEKFEESLSKELFRHFVISEKEKEALKLATEGYAFKEIANILKISQSAVEKRIIPMYKRFNVRSLTHLISFAHENHIFN